MKVMITIAGVLKHLKANIKLLLAIALVSGVVFIFSWARVTPYLTIPNYAWVSWFGYVVLLLLWALSIADRIIERVVRRYCLSIAGLMMLFVTFRSIKWSIENNPQLEQLMWYAYYIPHILAPLILFLIALSIEKKLYMRYRSYIYWLFAAAIGLIVIVLTNNYHQIIFKIIEWSESYDVVEYQLGFWIIAAWLSLFFIMTIILLIRNSKLPHTNRRIVLPLFVIFCYVVYVAFYMINPAPNGVGFVELMVTVCLIYVSLIESLVHVGLIPSNSNYQMLFENSAIPMIIVDEDYETLCRTKVQLPVDKSLYHQMSDGDQCDLGDDRLRFKRLSSGAVLWLDDMRDINRQIRQIEVTNRNLLIENELLQNDILLAKKEITLREKEHIYSEIENVIADKRTIVKQRIATLPFDQLGRRESLLYICLIGAYIKRMSNIILLKQLYDDVNALELENAILESMVSYRLKNTVIHHARYVDFVLPGELLQIVYRHFEDELEHYFVAGAALTVDWCERDGQFHLTWQFRGDAIEPFANSDYFFNLTARYGAHFNRTIEPNVVSTHYYFGRVETS